jgi:hypothetical protein
MAMVARQSVNGGVIVARDRRVTYRLTSLFSLGLQQHVVAQFFLAKTGLAFQYKM